MEQLRAKYKMVNIRTKDLNCNSIAVTVITIKMADKLPFCVFGVHERDLFVTFIIVDKQIYQKLKTKTLPDW